MPPPCGPTALSRQRHRNRTGFIFHKDHFWHAFRYIYDKSVAFKQQAAKIGNKPAGQRPVSGQPESKRIAQTGWFAPVTVIANSSFCLRHSSLQSNGAISAPGCQNLSGMADTRGSITVGASLYGNACLHCCLARAPCTGRVRLIKSANGLEHFRTEAEPQSSSVVS